MKDYSIVIFYSEGDGYYIADIPDLEGCSASGATPEEALREVLIGKDLWLETARDEGIALPVPSYEPEHYRRRARRPRMVLTTSEAAAALGVQPARVRQMILSGQLPAEKDGRDWWILRTDLEKAKDRPGVGYPKGRPRASSGVSFESAHQPKLEPGTLKPVTEGSLKRLQGRLKGKGVLKSLMTARRQGSERE